MAARGSPPAYQVLAETLRERILSGDLIPGEKLPIEPDLSAEFGMSRSTVREALRVLASQSLIATSRGVTGGSFVAHPPPTQIRSYLQFSLTLLTGAQSSGITVDDLLEARELLEIPAAGLAATRRSETDLDALRGTLADRRALDPARRDELGVDFHAALMRSAGNPLMEVLVGPLYGVLDDRFAKSDVNADFWRRLDDDHRRIYEAVRDRDGEAAQEAIRAHLAALRPAYGEMPRQRDRYRQDSGEPSQPG